MTFVRQTALSVVAALAVATPAAAQEQWLRDLEEHIEEHVEALARAFEERLERMQARETRNDRAGRELTEAFSRTVRLGENGTFDLQNTAGDIVVTGTGGNQVRIDAVRRVRAGSEADARGLLQALRVNVIERAGNVEVRTTYPGRRRGNASASVDYTISLPETANVLLRTMSGTVRVSNVRGELRAESVSGDISLSSVQRVRRLSTMSGNLEIADAQGAEIEGSTVSGDVTARDLQVRTIELTSVSGNLRFSSVESERVNLTSVSGDIQYAGELVRNGRYEIQSHSGNIRFTPQGDTGFDVEANTFSGTVRSDYDLANRDSLALGFARGRSRGLRGTFGGAGAALVLQTFSGDVTILRR